MDWQQLLIEQLTRNRMPKDPPADRDIADLNGPRIDRGMRFTHPEDGMRIQDALDALMALTRNVPPTINEEYPVPGYYSNPYKEYSEPTHRDRYPGGQPWLTQPLKKPGRRDQYIEDELKMLMEQLHPDEVEEEDELP